jgi:superfamily II DNA or RNA helicase
MTFVNDRPIQTKAFNEVTELLQTRDECLVKMFCGTGKSRVIQRIILERKHPLSVVVFPSLALIRQFTNDYLGNVRNIGLLNVSSEELAHITSTTDPAQIRHFLNNPKTKHQQKIICVTYQSLDVLLSSIGDTKIGIACFDEAHRTTSPESVKHVYGDEYRAKYEKRVFFTATPVNANGITMFDRERDEMGNYGDCGPLACEYTYLQGLRDAILSLFELRIDLYTQDTLGNMYESIARAILTTGNTRVLTFHADAAEESKSETSVLRFVDKAKFVEAFRAVCAKEFPDKAGKFTDDRITFTAITAETKNKDAILSAFETCTDDEIYIASSCRTIGEGVDTKKANMCVFVDPKSSPKDIIQNIGRICRKIAGSERQPATILIPVCIGWEKYREAGDDPEVQDKLIREQLNDRENGDYNAIMNIVAALKQEDPELYELCLRYPSNFTESERKHALEEQGFRVLEDNAGEGDDNDDAEPNVLYEYDIDELVENGERVEIHTSNTEQPIVYRGFDDGEDADEEDERPIQRFYEVEEENDDGEMEMRYHRIVPMIGEEEDEEDSNRRLNPPKATNRPRMNIHTNDEIKLLWRMGDVALGGQFGSGVLECEVERVDNDELWKENHQKMCEFIDENGRAPRQSGAKVDLDEKKIGQWISTQKKNYNPSGSELSKQRMKNPVIWQIWTETLEKCKKHLVLDWVQNWKDKCMNMCAFIDKNGKIPSAYSKSQEEKILGNWISTQKTNYNPRGSELSKQGMKNPEIWQTWKDTITDPKYNKHLVLSRVQEWMNNLETMRDFIDKHHKVQSAVAKDPEEKRLGRWVSTQKANYDSRGSEFSKYIMKSEQVWTKWTETLSIQMYNICLRIDRVQNWKNNQINLCAFIMKNGRTPNQSGSLRDTQEKRLGLWLAHQNKNYDPLGPEFSKEIMKTPEIWQNWTDMFANPKYSKALSDTIQTWKINYKNMCDYIVSYKKQPSHGCGSKDENVKSLGRWVSCQKKNYDLRGSEFSKQIMKTNPEIWQIWTDTLTDEKYSEALADPVQTWKNTHQKMCLHIDENGKTPSVYSKKSEETKLANWVFSQRAKYDPRGSEFSKNIMKTSEIWQIWTETIQKYPCLKKQGQESPGPSQQTPSPKPKPKPKPRLVIKKSHLIPNPSLECSAPVSIPNPSNSKRVITDSPYKLTGRAWSSQKSTTTHEKLRSNPAEWHAYHVARDISFQGYADQSQIPRNRVIAHLGDKRKHRLRILDLGCGRNNIAQHYADVDKNHKFAIQGYDHIAEEGSGARVGNIADLAAQEEDESADICIYSQSLMGSDWRNYLTEGHRMLRYNGEFIISEHIKMLDDVRAELGRLGCKVESIDADADTSVAEAEDADDKVAKWFVLVARKV